MSNETATIETRIFRTPEGQPTCASDFRTGEVCRFLLQRKMGDVLVCFFDYDALSRYYTRLAELNGYLVPCANCPLHRSGHE